MCCISSIFYFQTWILGVMVLVLLLGCLTANCGREGGSESEEATLQNAKYIVVGAGLWGSTIAERISTILKEPVIMIDKRHHLGGNCWSEVDRGTGIEYHLYGSHIFHTSLEHVWSYITQFTEFTAYRHHVITQYRGKPYNFPVNLKTINGRQRFSLTFRLI
jgi:monoamine oxidase